MKIVADHKIPFLKGALESCADMIYMPGKDISPAAVKGANALIVRTRTMCNRQLLEGSSVRFIASATIGYDHIDTLYCDENDIGWTNAPGCNASSVKQYVASALAYIIQREKKAFSDIVLGIVGAGHVGSRVAAMAGQLGIRTLINDPPRARREGAQAFTGLEELLSSANVISMHVPLQNEGEDTTWHMADNSFFQKIKPGTWFINSSRGEVAETAALCHALETGSLSGAVIDVWEHEPTVSARLLALTAIATPHIAGYSLDGKARGTSMSVQAISRFFELGKDLWEPDTIPEPPNRIVQIDCRHITPEALFRALALRTYAIEEDSFRLKQEPSLFERQREEYPVRREPQAYELLLKNVSDSHRQVAQALGFRL